MSTATMSTSTATSVQPERVPAATQTVKEEELKPQKSDNSSAEQQQQQQQQASLTLSSSLLLQQQQAPRAASPSLPSAPSSPSPSVSASVSAASDSNTDPTASTTAAASKPKSPKQDNDDDLITSLLDDDVLCGRGAGAGQHKGNLVYNKLVTKHFDEYFRAPNGEKKTIVSMIIQDVQNRNGRFLERLHGSDQYYIEIGTERTMSKVAQAFRDVKNARERKESRKQFEKLKQEGKLSQAEANADAKKKKVSTKTAKTAGTTKAKPKQAATKRPAPQATSIAKIKKKVVKEPVANRKADSTKSGLKMLAAAGRHRLKLKSITGHNSFMSSDRKILQTDDASTTGEPRRLSFKERMEQIRQSEGGHIYQLPPPEEETSTSATATTSTKKKKKPGPKPKEKQPVKKTSTKAKSAKKTTAAPSKRSKATATAPQAKPKLKTGTKPDAQKNEKKQAPSASPFGTATCFLSTKPVKAEKNHETTVVQPPAPGNENEWKPVVVAAPSAHQVRPRSQAASSYNKSGDTSETETEASDNEDDEDEDCLVI
eukprot:CAMPEP_0113452070 /NCGR_PEP_ID=MMETSP0014_2-20120614/6660_1 /TAXON_ID=2857 /ORGANISM="Nitzschia sp." /LENGTH=541 /DNA_ID=CAMNT_0000343437 /DNA_START=681 /DNA_END=2306 /DNA_ORIENTATION=+ /assembly_acc=CAM_ASM_000159